MPYDALKMQKAVIPDDFLFGLRKQDERKLIRNPIWFSQ
jgi:hypothetical protein